ncbi:MAG: hypothetical protein WCA38_11785 [Candidatus Acidiferrales bacterium]
MSRNSRELLAKGQAMGLPLGGARHSILQDLRNFWFSDEGQDLAEYAVMAAVILVIAISATGLLGGRAHNVFSTVVRSLRDCLHTH